MTHAYELFAQLLRKFERAICEELNLACLDPTPALRSAVEQASDTVGLQSLGQYARVGKP